VDVPPSLPFDIALATSFCGDAVFVIYLWFDTVVVLSFCVDIVVALSFVELFHHNFFAGNMSDDSSCVDHYDSS
jgi:hypothetical protein